MAPGARLAEFARDAPVEPGSVGAVHRRAGHDLRPSLESAVRLSPPSLDQPRRAARSPVAANGSSQAVRDAREHGLSILPGGLSASFREAHGSPPSAPRTSSKTGANRRHHLSAPERIRLFS